MAFSELLLLAFKGFVVASIPLAVVWAARGEDKLRRLAWVTAFFTFDLIVFGGFTRLTDAGLGCPDWPGCYDKANPLLAAHDIRAAEALMPTGPVTMAKAWIEMVHRYLAMGVGILIIVLVAWSWLRVRRGGRASPRLATAALALVCLQGAFGAWTVTMKLQPVIVTTHLLLGMSLLAILVWHAQRLAASSEQSMSSVTANAPGGQLRTLAIVGGVLLAIQIALGAWVSTNYAVLACSDFPLCQGQWVPAMDFTNGFHLLRALGKTGDGANLSFAALTAIHWAHRSFSVIAFAALGVLVWRAVREPVLKKPALLLLMLLATQFATGLVNVVFAWPLAAAVLHNAGAAGLVAVLVVINYRMGRATDTARALRPVSSDSSRSPELRIAASQNSSLDSSATPSHATGS